MNITLSIDGHEVVTVDAEALCALLNEGQIHYTLVGLNNEDRELGALLLSYAHTGQDLLKALREYEKVGG